MRAGTTAGSASMARCLTRNPWPGSVEQTLTSARFFGHLAYCQRQAGVPLTPGVEQQRVHAQLVQVLVLGQDLADDQSLEAASRQGRQDGKHHVAGAVHRPMFREPWPVP